jgi:peroxiredoxin
VVVNDVTVPFEMEIAVNGSSASGHFFDGALQMPSTEGHVDGQTLVLKFGQYGTTLTATLGDEGLQGFYDRGTRGRGYAFAARRHVDPAEPAGPVPSIDGDWRIPTNSRKGEQAWRFVVRQDGADVEASILRVDGDTGTLSGRYENGSFVLSHFSGARPMLLEVTPNADGTLRLVENTRTTLVAVREEEARAKGMPEPSDPTLYTRVRDPEARFTFSFPDLDGQIVSDTDERFQGKVVIVSVTGSWCPNCHDEAPFLVDLYRTHHDRGLEIVALGFEEAEQLENPTRVRGFIKQYGITYPFLLAGEPDQAPEKIPQAVNLNTFPAAFILGRDGRVRAVHAGYASRATGDVYQEEQQAFVKEIDQLLAE